jgi:GNAT superfamily N-acetyltransferase
MITFEKISTADIDRYRYAEELMVASFPEVEYRQLEIQRQITDSLNCFNQHIILEDGLPIGFIAWWDFTQFRFIEHFAIDPERRNRGLGQFAIDSIQSVIHPPIVLEAELPDNEINRRRIQFYQRNGFQLFENAYYQPPYRKGNQPIPMVIMALGNFDKAYDFKKIQSVLYREVYGQTT